MRVPGDHPIHQLPKTAVKVLARFAAASDGSARAAVVRSLPDATVVCGVRAGVIAGPRTREPFLTPLGERVVADIKTWGDCAEFLPDPKWQTRAAVTPQLIGNDNLRGVHDRGTRVLFRVASTDALRASLACVWYGPDVVVATDGHRMTVVGHALALPPPALVPEHGAAVATPAASALSVGLEPVPRQGLWDRTGQERVEHAAAKNWREVTGSWPETASASLYRAAVPVAYLAALARAVPPVLLSAMTRCVVFGDVTLNADYVLEAAQTMRLLGVKYVNLFVYGPTMPLIVEAHPADSARCVLHVVMPMRVDKTFGWFSQFVVE